MCTGESQNCSLGRESNNKPADLPWLEVISEAKEEAIQDHCWMADLNYLVRAENMISFELQPGAMIE